MHQWIVTWRVKDLVPKLPLMINGICREFAELVKANEVAKLPESEFEVDPGLREMIEAQIKEEEQTARQASRLHTAATCMNALSKSAPLFLAIVLLWIRYFDQNYEE